MLIQGVIEFRQVIVAVSCVTLTLKDLQLLKYTCQVEFKVEL